MRDEADERRGLGRRAAQARRDYWQGQYEAALKEGHKDAAANALRFVQEYDAFMMLMKCEIDVTEQKSQTE